MNPRRLVGHLEVAELRRGFLQHAERGAGLALGEEHGAAGLGREPAHQRRIEGGGDPGELVGALPRRGDVSRGDQDVHVCRKDPGPNPALRCFLKHATDRGRRDLDLTLSLPQLGEPGVRLSSRSAGLPVCLFGLRVLSFKIEALSQRRVGAGQVMNTLLLGKRNIYLLSK